MRSCSSKPERGIALLWMTMILLVLLLFIALGTDMAKLTVTRSQLQNAADAAALAGAGAFGAGNGAATVDTAVIQAIVTASYNQAYEGESTPVLVTPSDVAVDTTRMTVTVTTRREASAGTPIVPHFLQVVGITALDATATATAQAGWSCNYVPFAVQPPERQALVRGQDYLLKNAPPNGTEGTYWALRYPPCPGGPCEDVGGAARYLCIMTHGYPCCENVLKGACIPAEEGDMSGPTSFGIEELIDNDTDPTVGIHYDAYLANGLGNGRRIVIAPITTEMVKMRRMPKCFMVDDFGVFFLTQYASGNGIDNTVYGEYLGTPEEVGISPRRFNVCLIR